MNIMDWFETFLFFVVSCIVLSYMRILKEKATLPPGPMPLPFIGNLLQVDTKDIGRSLTKLKDKYGPVYSLYLGPRPGIVLCGYNAVKEGLIDQNDDFGDRGDYPVFLNFIGEHDLCFTNGERWKSLRRFALQTLRNCGMGKRSVEERIQEEARFLIEEFKKTNGTPVDPTNHFARTASNVICSIVFGSRFDYEDKRLLAITESIYNNFLIMSSTWGTLYNMYPNLMEYVPGPHKKIGKFFDMIYDISAESIKHHNETLDPENPRDYIDCFLMKIKEEKDNLDTAFYAKSLARTIQNLLFGGTETVSTNLRYGFLVLMKYPEVAEKMQEEIDRVVGRDRLPSIADKNKMPFTEAAIHELVRFCDVLPISLPRCTAKDTVFRGYSIPKGTHVTPLLASVHRDPSYYKEPNQFNPNNFLDENGAFRKNDALMPFGADISMDWWATYLLIFVFFVTCTILNFMRILKEKASLPPGPMPLPFIGNLWQVDTKDIGRSLMKLKDKYGPVYTLYLGPRPGIVLCGYNAVKEALIDQSEAFGDRGDYPVFLNFIGEHDLCFHNGERWKSLRRFALLTLKNFGMGKRSVEERIQEEARFLIEELKKTNGAPINPTNYFARTVSNVICSIVFGNRFDYKDKRLLAITESIYNNFLIMSSTWGTLYNMYPNLMDYVPGPHKRMGKLFDLIYDISAESIKYHKETLDPENPRDYIDCFLIKIKEEENNPDTAFYAKSLARTIQNLLFGGTETVSTNVRYGFLVLMKYPEVAEKMQAEIDRVVGRNRFPSIADRSKMPYTEAAIHELIRFCDVLPVSLPRCTSRDTVFRGYLVPKGTHVTPLLASVHYDPSYYQEPHKFNPNNFLDDKGHFKKNDAHMPFGAGKRVCLGESLGRMELFLYFTSLLQNFNFKPVVPKEEIDVTPTGSGLGNVPPKYKCCIVPR